MPTGYSRLSPFPWRRQVPVEGEPGATRTEWTTVPLEEAPTGEGRITAPEGVASFTRALPEATAAWVAGKNAERAAEEARLNTRAAALARGEMLAADEAARARRFAEMDLQRLAPQLAALLKLNPALLVRSGAAREPIGEFSRARVAAEREADGRGLTGEARESFIADAMARYRQQQATGTVLGGYAGPAQAARVSTAGKSAAAGERGRSDVRLEPPPSSAGGGTPTGKSRAEQEAFDTGRGKERAETAQQTVQDSIKAGLNLTRLLSDIENDPDIDTYGFSGRRWFEEGRDILSGATLGAVQPSAKYIQFRQRLRQAALTAFDFGGKQLTQTEKAFVLATVPSGEERTPQELRTVLAELKKRVTYLTTVQAKLANLPRDQYETEIAKELERFGRARNFNPATGELE